ncbi:MAG: transposase [Actinomycetota bacterium]|nr:transposase [Actinomycetota bacterium]
MAGPSKWSPEFREEPIRLYRESDESVSAVARRLRLGPETFRKWVPQDEIERGAYDGSTREEHAEIVKLRRRVRRSGLWQVSGEAAGDAAVAYAQPPSVSGPNVVAWPSVTGKTSAGA